MSVYSRSHPSPIPSRPSLNYEYPLYSSQSFASVPSVLSPRALLACHDLSMSESDFQNLLKSVRNSEFPIASFAAEKKFKQALSEFERKELLEYPLIFYIGSVKSPQYTDKDGHFAGVVGDHIAYRYEIIKEIGRGAFSRVLQCFDHRSSMIVALKVLRNNCTQMAVNERKVIKKLNFANTIKLFSSFTFRKHICLAFEMLGVSLSTFIKEINLECVQNLSFIRKVATDLLNELSSLHRQGIIHADIKPDNIVFTDKYMTTVKLIDFGNALELGKEYLDYIQTRYYRAPEIILRNKYDQAIDMWSLGCVLYELYTGQVLFPVNNQEEILDLLQSGDVLHSIKHKELKDLIARLIHKEPGLRLTSEIALNHPFLNHINK